MSSTARASQDILANRSVNNVHILCRLLKPLLQEYTNSLLQRYTTIKNTKRSGMYRSCECIHDISGLLKSIYFKTGKAGSTARLFTARTNQIHRCPWIHLFSWSWCFWAVRSCTAYDLAWNIQHISLPLREKSWLAADRCFYSLTEFTHIFFCDTMVQIEQVATYDAYKRQNRSNANASLSSSLSMVGRRWN